MIQADIDNLGESGCIVLVQDMALSWRQNVWFIGVTVCVTLLIALFFTLQGAWLVLPFAGLEIIVLVSVFYYWYKHNNRMEVLKFDREQLILERGVNQPEEVQAFARFWLKAELPHDADHWYLTRVILHHRDDRVEIGRFLNADDKKQLVKHIRQLMPVVNQFYSR